MKSILLSLPLLPLVSAGTVLWSGLFNEDFTVADFDTWSWSNQIPPYQWYIHGTAPTASYLAVSADSKNPNSTLAGDAQGLRLTLDNTSSWNGQTMMRTELIPQIEGDVDLGSGVVNYHFSLGVPDEIPGAELEHQIAFFESHFTELKYGGSDSTNLTFYAGGAAHYSIPLTAGVWYNFAYNIDFDAGSVSLYTSTGGDDLEQVVEGVSVDAQTNSADWHVGVLRLDNATPGVGGVEEWDWSGVRVEGGDVTLGV
ncbi:hypothetical protein BDW59DRAFT_177948 [Aspergillus cavernicola]|uniref:Glycoside hydrolase 131 catalytic N-terminal domain-containing protein n=1 Tax=Aspergillus cavernicola TaxID=176166 RepID=A0ABR4HFW1_9EURO